VIELTGDGSQTLRNPDLNVTYHSSRGAIGESRHVFIRHGLDYVAAVRKEISILEVGFGSGLNAFLAFLFAQDNTGLHIDYTGIEKFPIPEETVLQLNYPEALEAGKHQEVFHRMHREREFVQGNYSFTLRAEDIRTFTLEKKFHLVFFDPFDPLTQPEMWYPETLQRIRDHLHSGAILVTYSSRGQFRRDLKVVGFEVEKLVGPPGKREMVRATLQ
jgi:tRNA U34 5-methylaminomethyl-2-thiouridine-forming methyltransferase MnmC